MTYAFGDIHGCLTQLQRLVELCERDAGTQKITFIFLGDYIDRGPDSRGVLDFLIDLQTWSPDEIVCLRGNHEDLLLSAIDDEANEPNWLINGGTSTLYSYRVASPIDIPPKHIAWLRSLPTFHDDGKRFFVMQECTQHDRSINRTSMTSSGFGNRFSQVARTSAFSSSTGTPQFRTAFLINARTA
jgi:serine/threonine protein phosphatase 1